MKTPINNISLRDFIQILDYRTRIEVKSILKGVAGIVTTEAEPIYKHINHSLCVRELIYNSIVTHVKYDVLTNKITVWTKEA